jgi:hypothetical protein
MKIPQEVYYSNGERIMQNGRLQEIYNNQAGRNHYLPQQEDFVSRVQQSWVQQIGIEGGGTDRNNLKKPLRNEQNTEGMEKQEGSRRDEELKAQVKKMLLKAKYEDKLEIEKEDKKRQEEKKKQQQEKENEERKKEDKERIKKLEDQLKQNESYIQEMKERNEYLAKNRKHDKSSEKGRESRKEEHNRHERESRREEQDRHERDKREEEHDRHTRDKGERWKSNAPRTQKRVQSAPPAGERRGGNRWRPRDNEKEDAGRSRDNRRDHTKQAEGDQGSKSTKRKKEESPRKPRKHAREQESKQKRQPREPRAKRKQAYLEKKRDQEKEWQVVGRRKNQKGNKKRSFKKRREVRKDKDEVLPLDEFLKEGNILRITGFDCAEIIKKLAEHLDGDELKKRQKREKSWTPSAVLVRGSRGTDCETLYGFAYKKIEATAQEGEEVQEKDMKTIPENIAQLAQQIQSTYCISSRAAETLVFNIKKRCGTWMEGFLRAEIENKEKENEWHPKVTDFIEGIKNLIEEAEQSMCNTHIIVTAREEVTGEGLSHQFSGYTRVREADEKEQARDNGRIDQTEIVVSNFPSKVVHFPWMIRVGEENKICKVYRMIEFLKHRIDDIELTYRGKSAEYMRFSRVINPCSIVSIVRNMRKNTVVLRYGKCGTKDADNCTVANGICKHMDIISTCRHPLYVDEKGREINIDEVQSEWRVQRVVEKEGEEKAAVNAVQEEDEENIPIAV